MGNCMSLLELLFSPPLAKLGSSGTSGTSAGH